MEIAFLWFAFAIVVGAAAKARGRDGVGWFLLALIISPLIALLLVLVMARKGSTASANPTAQPFEPDGLHQGIPYRTAFDGSVEAIVQGTLVRFSDYNKFSKVTGVPDHPPLPPAIRSGNAGATQPNWDKNPWAWFVILGVIGFLVLVGASK
jgi:phosphotransferase system  glucose/maltose/N-acetylglucosamine-specific IIC component